MKEKYFIDKYTLYGYNVLNIVDPTNINAHKVGEANPYYGRKHSLDTRNKISQNHADVSGEKNPKAKLTSRQVRLIRWTKKLKMLRPTNIFLSKFFGVGATTISNILKEKTWKHIKI